MAHLAERGWVCVTANYRLSPRATWPDQIVDVKRALAWTKANIANHGGDPGFVVITGGSAGGHLCALAALTVNVSEFQPGFEGADTSVAGSRAVLRCVRPRGTRTAPTNDGLELVPRRTGLQVPAGARTSTAGSRPPRSATSARTPRRSSCSTAPTIRWCASSRRRCSCGLGALAVRPATGRVRRAARSPTRLRGDALAAHARHGPRRRAFPGRRPHPITADLPPPKPSSPRPRGDVGVDSPR